MRTEVRRPVGALGSVLLTLVLVAGWPESAEAVDQEWVELEKLTASDGASFDQFGHSVAVEGSVIVVGAPDKDAPATTSGAVYVFARDGSGRWHEQLQLTASDGGGDWSFGRQVVLSGETLAAAAPGAHDFLGAVYLFERDAGGSDAWGEVQKLQDPEGLDRSWVSAVGLDGDTLIVGSVFDDQAANNAGAVYVYERQGVGGTGPWTLVDKLMVSDADGPDEFGSPIAVDGDFLVGGARKDDVFGTDSGSAYVFERDAVAWAEAAKLVPMDGVFEHQFGNDVAIDGETVAVGAVRDSSQGNASGAAYVFERNGGAWDEVAKLVPSDAALGDRWGGSLEIVGDTLVMGADNRQTAYVFERDPAGTWQEIVELVPSDGFTGNQFSDTLAFRGNTLVVGAPLDEDVAFSAGAAYVFQQIAPELSLAGTCPGEMTLGLSGGTPAARAVLLWGLQEGTSEVPPGPCAGTELGLVDPRLAGLPLLDGGGAAEIAASVPAEACDRKLQAVDAATCLVSGVVALSSGD